MGTSDEARGLLTIVLGKHRKSGQKHVSEHVNAHCSIEG